MAVERKFVEERLKKFRVKEWMAQEVRNAGFGGVDITRTPLGTQITLFVERPGLVIGKGGRRIRNLTEKLKEFGIDNPQVSVDEIEKPEFNPQLMASLLARALERGWYFRKAGYRFLYRIMEAGAKGCEIEISGKLTGERARTEKFLAGTMVHTGEPAISAVKTGFDVAIKKLGVMGIKVRIIPPDAELPDEFSVKEKSRPEVEEVESKEAQESPESQPTQETEASEASEPSEAKKEAESTERGDEQ
ncbi:SSU ribosomal protein S3P [Archaeoglobus sulfaticallidus PM70-1]|uniref:Small ribosomal subunit protein uS3 n=1 Tax=Archaeoglobus sulfaticallidus PM70-1 TaxID=387631 RepID=N0BAY3_9EURY|nr:30S ribosomal protein S3 [Archaeoglobus sulfaticallidus]AGK60158.1 SSU ribosomal protein S3P [Archaeoglobus sulfaticallidus PM70-1]